MFVADHSPARGSIRLRCYDRCKAIGQHFERFAQRHQFCRQLPLNHNAADQLAGSLSIVKLGQLRTVSALLRLRLPKDRVYPASLCEWLDRETRLPLTINAVRSIARPPHIGGVPHQAIGKLKVHYGPAVDLSQHKAALFLQLGDISRRRANVRRVLAQ